MGFQDGGAPPCVPISGCSFVVAMSGGDDDFQLSYRGMRVSTLRGIVWRCARSLTSRLATIRFQLAASMVYASAQRQHLT